MIEQIISAGRFKREFSAVSTTSVKLLTQGAFKTIGWADEFRMPRTATQEGQTNRKGGVAVISAFRSNTTHRGSAVIAIHIDQRYTGDHRPKEKLITRI